MVKLRKELLLGKIVKFDKRCFSTLTVPASPSKAYDNMVKNGGLNFSFAGTAMKNHIDYVLLAVTNKCHLNCRHCYEKHNLNSSEEIPIGKWKEVIINLQSYGTGIIVLTGGEPMLQFSSVLELLNSGDKNKSDFHIHTSGYSVTEEKAERLKAAGLTAAAVGLDDADVMRNDFLRGSEGAFDRAVNALKCFNAAGIFTYLNTCLSKQLVSSGDLFKLLELAKTLNVGLVHLLEPRPCGGFNSFNMNDLFTDEERNTVINFIQTANYSPRYKKYPLVYSTNYIESPYKMGCMMGGLSHFHIDSAGNVNPCVFFPVSFGNIVQEDFNIIYQRMRKEIPSPVKKNCPAISLSDIIKEKQKQPRAFPISFTEIQDAWPRLVK